MEHNELVERAVRWLKTSSKGRSACGVVVPELVSYCGEQPDAIGWNGGGRSTVIECKASRADFLADKKKPSRIYGAGVFRYYLCPVGLIAASEVPESWGLLYCHPNRISVEQQATPNMSRNLSAELSMMYSLLRRVEVRGQLTRCLSPKWGGDFESNTPEELAPTTTKPKEGEG
jgi:hypothetical protein